MFALPAFDRNVRRRLVQVAAPAGSREPVPSPSTQHRLEACAASSSTIRRWALLVWMTRLWPGLLAAAQVVQPETILRWHRAGFTAFWRWRSRKRAGRPKIDRELRDLIRRMSKENPKWGASRIHGELLMLGFEVAQSTVSKYMVQGGSPSQGWKTFFRNHAQAIAAIDLFVVPTLTFERFSRFWCWATAGGNCCGSR
jgi:hypothetical protein